MDYLDPKKKRTHKTRIMIGYGLFAIAISIATLILVYVANGYYINSTGEVIQNGLVFVDSKPTGAQVVLNGQEQGGLTDARLVIPSGDYNIELRKDGYDTWSRQLRLEGGSLRRLTYARLFPTELESTNALSIPDDITDATQSINKRWLALSHPEKPLELSLIDTEQAELTLQTVVVPDELVSDPEKGVIEFVEWVNDDSAFLVTYTRGELIEHILVDRVNPEESINLNTEFENARLEISLRDRSKDQFFAYEPREQAFYTASLANGLSAEPLLPSVLEYTAFGDNWVLYITQGDDPDLVEARFLRGAKDILLKELQPDDTYLLQLAKLGNAPVMAISSPVEERAVVYNDPQNYLNQNPEASIPVATTALRISDPQDLIISSDSSVVLVHGKSGFATHEFEADRSYTFKLDAEIDTGHTVTWMDGQHATYSMNGVQYVTDFDGSNRKRLVPSIVNAGSFYSDNVSQMYALSPAVAATEDEPARPVQLTITQLLTPSDR